MLIDKNSGVHLYIQIADSIRDTITSGGFPAGSALPTEEDLCRLYGVSRYPMRQAMDMLVKEGYLLRVRGKGTFVTDPAAARAAERRKLLALVLPVLMGDYPADILRGFEKAAGDAGYGSLVAVSGSAETETARVGTAIGCGASGVVLFPFSKTSVTPETVEGWANRGVYVSFVDRNPGVEGADYVGSDNAGGGYMAAFHMKQRGFENAVFVSDVWQVSSVSERLEGFRKGIGQFGMRLINDDVLEGGASPDPAACSVAGFVQRLGLYMKHLPFAVFAANDYAAARVMEAAREKGAEPGRDIGVIGFDNSAACEHMSPKLTSVAQNGYLIGQAAAQLAIEKIETGSRQCVRHILPTQLVARRSCGEG